MAQRFVPRLKPELCPLPLSVIPQASVIPHAAEVGNKLLKHFAGMIGNLHTRFGEISYFAGSGLTLLGEFPDFACHNRGTLPCYPALAASIAAFSASRSVCRAGSPTISFFS